METTQTVPVSSNTDPLLEEEKQRFLKILREKLGIVSLACIQMKLPVHLFNQWVLEDADFASAVHECEETALDFVEGKLFEKINAGDPRLIRFFLETRGKKRGYITKKEIEAVSLTPIILTEEEALMLSSKITNKEITSEKE